MQPLELAQQSAQAIHDVPMPFMIDPATYVHGAELGYVGADFYLVGRGAVLGDVPPSVVVAAYVFFAPEAVTAAFERSGSVQSRADAAQAFVETGHEWARANLSGDALEVVAELATKIIAAANPSGAALFAGLRELDVPTDAPAAAQHQLNVLRELRGGLHGGAVLASGLTPREAVALEHPMMAAIHGWHDDFKADESRRGLLEAAHLGTNRAFARALEVLDDAERDAFASACSQLSHTG